MYIDSVMNLLTVNSVWGNEMNNRARTILCDRDSPCRNFNSPYGFPNFGDAKKRMVRAPANKNSVKKPWRQKKSFTQTLNTSSLDELDEVTVPALQEVNNVESSKRDPLDGVINPKKDSITIPSRVTVLQACIVTSGLMAALGVLIRQVSHVASAEGLPVVDCSTELSFSFEAWHLQLVGGLVIMISSCRYLLLNAWTDFAESSEAANQQVLSSLQPVDYAIVAFLPGISEELLFRGTLLPLFGINGASAVLVGVLFGALHLGSGRKYSFAIWATFVGVVYGYAAIVSSSLLVPMASHAANNLVGGLLWRYRSKLPE